MQEKTPEEEHGIVIHKMEVVQHIDGFCYVINVPSSFGIAMGMVLAAAQSIANSFIRMAKENRLNEHNVVDGSKIVLAKGKVPSTDDQKAH
jgi:hypothetical protein